MAEARDETAPMRRVAQLGGHDAIPDETTRVNFRRVLETHPLAAQRFSQVNAHRAGKGLRLRDGTSGAAPRIAAPSSTKTAAVSAMRNGIKR